MALATEVSGRTAYLNSALIQVYPVSKGTWTVRALYGTKKQKRFSGLKGHTEVVIALIDAQEWLDEQAAR